MNTLLVVGLIFFMLVPVIIQSPIRPISEPLQVVSAIDKQVYDKNLKIETVYDGLEYPTSMAFIGSGDILVTEKDKGTVERILTGQKQAIATFDVAVANVNER